jgi:hypothetical protein
MDVELLRALDMVGDIQEALLPVCTMGVDVPCHSVRSFLDPQQLRL